MRIGMLSYDFDPAIGGLGRVVQDEFCELSRVYQNDTFYVLSPSKQVHTLSSRLAKFWWGKRGGCPLFSVSLLFRLRRLVRRFRMDLLHVHAGSGGVWLLTKPPCQLLVTSHHTYLQEAQLLKRRSPILAAWKRLMAACERRTYQLADRILCVSEDTKNVLIDSYDIPPAKVGVLENGIDLKPYALPADVHKDGNTILFVGRLEPRKGVWIILRAFTLLKRTYANLRLRLVGANLLENAVAEFLQQNTLRPQDVQVLGHLPSPALIREMQEATIVVVPSLVEGFGLTAVEAMAAGTCVVASDCSGLKSIVDEGRTGYLFLTGNPEDCARAIERALLHPHERTSMERCGRSEAQVRFSLADHVRKLYGAYSSLASSSPLTHG